MYKWETASYLLWPPSQHDACLSKDLDIFQNIDPQMVHITVASKIDGTSSWEVYVGIKGVIHLILSMKDIINLKSNTILYLHEYIDYFYFLKINFIVSFPLTWKKKRFNLFY